MKLPPDAFRRRRYGTTIDVIYPGEAAHIVIDPRTGQQVEAEVYPGEGLRMLCLRWGFRLQYWLGLSTAGERGTPRDSRAASHLQIDKFWFGRREETTPTDEGKKEHS